MSNKNNNQKKETKNMDLEMDTSTTPAQAPIAQEATVNPKSEKSKDFNALMQSQKDKVSELEMKAGGPISVDDTAERIKRSEEIAVKGKRKGKSFKPSNGTAAFMVQQNAKYLAVNKPAPYSDECLKQTLKRES